MVEKPVVEVGITGIDYVAYQASETGNVVMLFTTDRDQELAIVLTPAMLSLLETKLAKLREEMAAIRLLQ